MSFRAVGCEFDVNESTSSYIQERKREWAYLGEAAPGSAEGPPARHDEGMEKREMRLTN